jgi:hypothetical protein
MDGIERFQRRPHAWRQGVIGGGLAGKQRVAAPLRNLDGIKDRADGWALEEAGIRMPTSAEIGLV